MKTFHLLGYTFEYDRGDTRVRIVAVGEGMRDVLVPQRVLRQFALHLLKEELLDKINNMPEDQLIAFLLRSGWAIGFKKTP